MGGRASCGDMCDREHESIRSVVKWLHETSCRSIIYECMCAFSWKMKSPCADLPVEERESGMDGGIRKYEGVDRWKTLPVIEP